jgi:hypothetical protein
MVPLLIGSQLVFASFHLLLAESAVVIYKGAKHEFWRFAASQSFFSANVCKCVETEILKANTLICCTAVVVVNSQSFSLKTSSFSLKTSPSQTKRFSIKKPH